MEGMDYWRLSEELSVKQAALLITGTDPADADNVENWSPEKRPIGYDAAKHALFHALKRGDVDGTLVPMSDYDVNGNDIGYIDGSIELNRSLVTVESVRTYLAARGFNSGFFMTVPKAAPDYLNPKHHRYAPKLAAAVGAWLAVTDVNGKHPKQALTKWLRENAAEFGLSDDEGKPNETGIEETAKVANWQPGGGAPKTPNG